MNTALIRNKKGLTLIELLAVIVILGIIAAIAVPAIGSVIANSRTKADERSVELIQSAAVMWAMQQTTPPANGSNVTVQALVDSGYLTTAPKQQTTGYTYTDVTLNITTGGAYTAVVSTPTAPPAPEE